MLKANYTANSNTHLLPNIKWVLFKQALPASSQPTSPTPDLNGVTARPASSQPTSPTPDLNGLQHSATRLWSCVRVNRAVSNYLQIKPIVECLPLIGVHHLASVNHRASGGCGRSKLGLTQVGKPTSAQRTDISTAAS